MEILEFNPDLSDAGARLLIMVASLVVEHGLGCLGASVVSTHGLIAVALRLRSRGSTVGVHRLSYSVACEMLLLR